MRYASRKFVLACVALLMVAVWSRGVDMTGQQIVTAFLGVLALYKGAQIVDDRLNGKKDE
jgi:uncharacterized membrane protein